MAWKTVLTVVTAADRAAATVAAAGAVAQAHDAHLDILAVGTDRTQAAYAFVTAGTVVQQAIFDRAREEAAANEAAARAAAAKLPEGVRWAAEGVVAQVGALSELVAARARFADLVVLPRPYGDGRGPEDEAVVEAALFDGHAPVVVLPDPLRDIGVRGRRVVVAWNESGEAMAAVRAALPMLRAADLVSVTVVDPPGWGPEPGAALTQMLVRHGVRAEVAVLAKTAPRVSDVLMRHVRDLNADVLVIGAYGHSRLREALLGGATRDLLAEAEVPLFLAR
jgi:nucleotide-binding universal stress UspA family protein